MNGKVYAEVDFIIENLDEDYKKRIPQKLLELIKEKNLSIMNLE